MAQDVVIHLEFANATRVHPVGLAALCAACAGVVAVPRRHVPSVFIALAALIPSAQRVVVGGLDFNFIRVLVLVGMFRALVRSDFMGVRWCAVDACVIAGMVLKLIGVTVRSGFGPNLIAGLGAEFEAVGAYLVFRTAIRTPADFRAILLAIAAVTLAALPFFLVERSTGRNLFAAFGGVPQVTVVREGRLRCQGAIAHAILAGCFFAAFVPMWIGLAIRSAGSMRAIAIGASAAATGIVVCSASSTPVAAILQGGVAWMLFRIRGWLRLVWIALIVLLCVLHMVMKQPVWHLIGRLDFVGGSTGYHRFLLIDASINHVADWWAFGLHSTEYWGEGLVDVTNQFILDGVRGGIGATLALVLGFVLVFGYCGRVIRASARESRRAGSRQARESWRSSEALAYGIGAAMFVHIGAFTAVAYFGQTITVWQLILAAGASVASWPDILRGQMAGRVPQRVDRQRVDTERRAVVAAGTGQVGSINAAGMTDICAP